MILSRTKLGTKFVLHLQLPVLLRYGGVSSKMLALNTPAGRGVPDRVLVLVFADRNSTQSPQCKVQPTPLPADGPCVEVSAHYCLLMEETTIHY